MAVNFKIAEGQNYKVTRLRTDAASTAIAVGDMVAHGITTAGYAEFCPATAVDTSVGIGIATSVGTHTATEDGFVDVAHAEDGIEIVGTVTTASNLTRARVGTSVSLDVSTLVQTVDENDAVNGFILIWESPGGNFDTVNGVHRFMLFSNWS